MAASAGARCERLEQVMRLGLGRRGSLVVVCVCVWICAACAETPPFPAHTRILKSSDNSGNSDTHRTHRTPIRFCPKLLRGLQHGSGNRVFLCRCVPAFPGLRWRSPSGFWHHNGLVFPKLSDVTFPKLTGVSDVLSFCVPALLLPTVSRIPRCSPMFPGFSRVLVAFCRNDPGSPDLAWLPRSPLISPIGQTFPCKCGGLCLSCVLSKSVSSKSTSKPLAPHPMPIPFCTPRNGHCCRCSES